MSVKNPKEFFLVLLSELRQGTERTGQAQQDLIAPKSERANNDYLPAAADSLEPLLPHPMRER
jgi:hypothetical protein